MNAFVEFVESRELDLEEIIIDPDPVNRRAIRTFEKAGFSREAVIVTPGGTALLMRRHR